MGLIEGDGWFSITKGGKYLKYEFGIELGIRDVQLIYKIKDLLGVGEINFRDTEVRSKTVILRVRKKSHLINVILPIFDKYPFISNKQYDYLRFKDNLLKGITLYENLDINYVRPLEPLNNVDYIISLPYFSSWLIGILSLNQSPNLNLLLRQTKSMSPMVLFLAENLQESYLERV